MDPIGFCPLMWANYLSQCLRGGGKGFPTEQQTQPLHFHYQTAFSEASPKRGLRQNLPHIQADRTMGKNKALDRLCHRTKTVSFHPTAHPSWSWISTGRVLLGKLDLSKAFLSFTGTFSIPLTKPINGHFRQPGGGTHLLHKTKSPFWAVPNCKGDTGTQEHTCCSPFTSLTAAYPFAGMSAGNVFTRQHTSRGAFFHWSLK